MVEAEVCGGTGHVGVFLRGDVVNGHDEPEHAAARSWLERLEPGGVNRTWPVSVGIRVAIKRRIGMQSSLLRQLGVAAFVYGIR